METSAATFRSVWDWTTYTILAATSAICFIPALIECDLTSLAVGAVIVLIIIFTFLSTSYRIKGDTLIVRCALKSRKYPISKIAKIRPTRSILSAPALSMKHRIAITFTDRKVTRSFMPLVISPADRQDFLDMLTAINPHIEIENL